MALYVVLLVTVAAVFVMLLLLLTRMNNNAKPSVKDREAYHNLAIKPGLGKFIYQSPSNYERFRDKIVAVNPQLQLHEKQLNSTFRDKIPWCLPPTYGDLEMNGAFPAVKACRLEALCKMMKENTEAFKSEFNKYKSTFVANPENLGYDNVYGRIDINEGDNTFPETRRILGSSFDYTRTQVFNKYAGYNVMSTTFTVLYPGASIRPHFGPTNYKYRIHLCLDIDGVGGIVTAYGTRYWKVGEIFILDDSYLHAGFYEGTRPRVIIMVDIAKPGLTFQHMANIVKSVADIKASQTIDSSSFGGN